MTVACDHVAASVADPGAGTSYSVPALAGGLARLGSRVRLHTVKGWRAEAGPAPAPEGVDLLEHAQDLSGVPMIGRLCASGEMERSLSGPHTGQVIHSHGLWLMANVQAAAAARRSGRRFVAAPRGMLGAEALAFSASRKALFWRAFQRNALARADCIHATSEAEAEDVRAAGIAAPVCVVPNGVALPPDDAAEWDRPRRSVLSLGRIHPKKGLDALIAAWALVERDHPDIRLRIVGPAELGHDEDLRRQAGSLGLQRVSIEGPAYGGARTEAYRDAALFVLPTLNENFAMTVAEALGHGVPVVSSKGAPWAGLATEGCGWWVDRDPQSLSAAIREALDAPQARLADMGRRGRTWMDRDFSWDRASRDMLDVYNWLVEGGTPPATVRLDTP